MNILIIGKGGREHAMAWKLNQSSKVDQIFIAPGNAGTANLGKNFPIDQTDFRSIKELCLEKSVDYVLVGPEEPLVKGIVDFFNNDPDLKHISLVGPNAMSSRLEGSKSFAKSFMAKYHIPTPGYNAFTQESYADGVEYIKKHPLPIVLKADGLAAGKGVIICHNHIEALAEFELIIQRAKFGEAGKTVVVESFIRGIEMSVFVLTDGDHFVLLPEAKDYKQVGTGDTGLNTGGMGAISPVPFFDDTLKQKVIDRIIEPTIQGLKKENLEYKGFIFFGLMISNNEPFVIEYNCRMGDPETEAVIPRIKNDLFELFESLHNGNLGSCKIETDKRSTATVVAVSGGYPGPYQKGYPIFGLDRLDIDGTLIFHSGTKQGKDQIETAGGRVLAVTSYGDNIQESVEQSVYALEQIRFEDMYYRDDIGFEFIRRN